MEKRKKKMQKKVLHVCATNTEAKISKMKFNQLFLGAMRSARSCLQDTRSTERGSVTKLIANDSIKGEINQNSAKPKIIVAGIISN